MAKKKLVKEPEIKWVPKKPQTWIFIRTREQLLKVWPVPWKFENNYKKFK